MMIFQAIGVIFSRGEYFIGTDEQIPVGKEKILLKHVLKNCNLKFYIRLGLRHLDKFRAILKDALLEWNEIFQ